MTFSELERLAVVENEVRHLNAKHDEFRDEVRGDFRAVRSDVAAIDDKIDRIEKMLTQAHGAALLARISWGAVIRVASWTGGIAAFGFYMWEKMSAILPALPR